MLRLAVLATVVLARVLFRSRAGLLAENLALRQQLVIFKHKWTRPRLAPADRLCWVFLRGAWRNWANVLIVVEPDTVVRWHRQGFTWFWRWISRPKRVGRPRISFKLPGHVLLFELRASPCSRSAELAAPFIPGECGIEASTPDPEPERQATRSTLLARVLWTRQGRECCSWRCEKAGSSFGFTYARWSNVVLQASPPSRGTTEI